MIIKQRNIDRWIGIEEKRFGLTPIIVILQTELAAISIYYISQLANTPIYLLISIVAIFASIGNALNIACVHMRYILYCFGISCTVSILLMLYCLIQ